MTGRMRVFHDTDDFVDGEDMILTLQDKPILNELGELNEEDDEGVLVNDDLYEKQKTEHQNYVRNNVKKLANVQTAHLDEKFGEIDRKALLPHYDERKFTREGVLLDDQGEFNTEKLQQLEQIRQKLKSKKGLLDTLENATERQVASEYKQEKTPKSVIFKKKRKREATQGDSLLDILETQAEENPQEEFKDRKRVKESKKQDELKQQLLEQNTKRNNYEQAVANSKEELQQSKQRWEGKQSDEILEEKVQEVDKRQDKLEKAFWEDDDELLRKSIEKARNLQKMQNIHQNIDENEETNGKGLGSNSNNSELFNQNESNLSRLMAESVEVEEDQKRQEMKKREFAVPMSKNVKTSKTGASDLVEINFREDDLKFIATDENRRNESDFVYKSETKKTLKDTQKGTFSVVNVSMPTQRLKGKRYHDHIQEEEEFQKKLQDDNMTEEEFNKIREDLEEAGLRKDNLGQGLHGFLSELEDRGILLNDNIDYSGRNLDIKPHEDGTLTRDNDRIQLEYRDDSGKVMTKKQAFRYICWKFHGQGPSRNKLEKIKMKELEREKQLTKNLSEDSIIMKNLKNSQKITSQPYIVLQKRN